MAFYSGNFANATASTTNDTRTIVTTATGAGSVVAVHHLFIGGEASSSTVVRWALNRPSANGTTPTNQVPEKINPASVAAAFTMASTWSAQPTLSTNDVLNPTFNAFGGVFKFDAIPGAEIIVGAQGAVANLSLRSRSGVPVVSGHFILEEK